METFVIHIDDGSSYMVYARYENGQVQYCVHIDRYLVTFKDNPNWDTLGAFITPVNPPPDLDKNLLEEIAEKIDNYNL